MLMNEFLYVLQVWLCVFVLVATLTTLSRYLLPQIRPIHLTFGITILLVPIMVYAIIPFISHANAKPLEEPIKMQTDTMNKTRYEIGLENLKKIDGEVGEKVIESLKDIAPDLGRYVIEFPFGDIYNRPELDLRSREIATIAALTAMGNAQPQLKVHIQAGLNVGLSEQEIVEIIMQMSVYSGFPSALNGITAAKEVFAANLEK